MKRRTSIRLCEYYTEYWCILGQEYAINLFICWASSLELRHIDASTFDIEGLMKDFFVHISSEYVQLTLLRIIYYMSFYKVPSIIIRPKKLYDFDFIFLWLQDEDRGRVFSSFYQKIHDHVMLCYLADTVNLYIREFQFRLILAFFEQFRYEFIRVRFN